VSVHYDTSLKLNGDREYNIECNRKSLSNRSLVKHSYAYFKRLAASASPSTPETLTGLYFAFYWLVGNLVLLLGFLFALVGSFRISFLL
jgi:hypothetical protein